ncbi:MAG: hypothetical protein FWJ74_03415 [Gemmatimonadota bacterium]|mgnify:CR=1 FL=1
MNGWDIVTWSAIVVLVAGSVAVFVWFLGAARELLRDGRDEQDPS